MTPSDTKLEPCREAFEAWYSPGRDRSLARDGDSYLLMQAHQAWKAWQTSWKAALNSTPSPAKVMTEGELKKQAYVLATNIRASIRVSTSTSREAANEIINLAKAYKDGAK